MDAERRVLLVDDDGHIRELCRLYLEQDGFAVAEAEDGESALRLAASFHPDLVVLDLGLPRKSGLDVARELVGRGIPVLILTARDSELDRVVGLELGADDYVTKPFSPRELVARVRAVLRRSERRGDPAGPALSFEHFAIDPLARRLAVRGQPVEIPPKEFDLLLALASHPRQVLSRDQLLERVWGFEFFGDHRTVDVHVQRVRKKVEPDPAEPRYIITVWGVGYRFDPEPPRSPKRS